MDVRTAIRDRRSVRSYAAAEVEDDKIRAVLEAGRLAPSAANRQEWEFVVVKDRETRRRLATAAFGQRHVAEAPVVLVACATQCEHVMTCGQSAYTVDVSIAFAYMLLQAHELGLGTCWIGHFREPEVKAVLGIPDVVRVVAMSPLGYPDQPPQGKPRKSLEQIVSYERYERR